MRVRIGADGKPPAPFTHPVQPLPEAAGTCSKCGGNTHADDFTSWTKETGTVQKRTYRCMQHGHRCPTHTVILGQDGQEEGAVAKPKTVNCTQTMEWCEAQKAAMLAKHLAYRDVAKDAAISQSALAQGLTMKMSLSVETQARVEKAIAGADPAVALKVRKERDSRKPKPKATALPASLQVSPEKVNAWAAEMEKENLEQVMSNLAAQDALPAGATVTWSEDPNEAVVDAAVRADIPPPRGYESWKQFKESGGRPVSCSCDTGERALNLLVEVQQLQKAVEARVQSISERAEERYTAMAQGHQIHEDRLCSVESEFGGKLATLETDVDCMETQLGKRFTDLEERLTTTFDHLTEQIAGLQPPAVVDDAVEGDWRIITTRPADGLDFWMEEQRRNQAPSPDELVTSLSRYSDSQLAALVAAATARREMLKAMEAA